MSKAEEFIENYTKDGTNQIINGNYGTIIPHFAPWLTPEQALRAVEIEREEMLEEVVKWIENNFSLYEGISGYYVAKDLKQAMKDEYRRMD